MPDATAAAEGDNPLCGDEICVRVRLKDGRVDAVKFTGEGCAISKASASLMTEAITGKTLDEARALIAKVHGMLTGECACDLERDGELAALGGVRQFPQRVKCATLAWHALDAALHGDAKASTES